jgi:hypothetical protein
MTVRENHTNPLVAAIIVLVATRIIGAVDTLETDILVLVLHIEVLDNRFVIVPVEEDVLNGCTDEHTAVVVLARTSVVVTPVSLLQHKVNNVGVKHREDYISSALRVRMGLIEYVAVVTLNNTRRGRLCGLEGGTVLHPCIRQYGENKNKYVQLKLL